MPKVKHNSAASLAWARALIELAEEQKQLEPIGAELAQIAGLVRENPDFARFLADPTVSQVERGETVARIFGEQIQPLLRNFLGVLNARNAMSTLAAVADAYHDLLDVKLGKVEVDVTVAHALSPQDLNNVRKRISEALKKEAVIHQKVDDRIIGGMVLRVGDRLIDGSVKAQLQDMHDQLLSGRKMITTPYN